MTENLLLIIFYATALTAAAGFVSGLLKMHRYPMIFLVSRTFVCLAGIIYIIFAAKRLPLFGSFEAMVHIIFVMGILTIIFYENHEKPGFLLKMDAAAALLIAVMLHGRPMALNANYYMYSNIWVILFFSLRLLAAGFFVHSAILCACSAFSRKQDDMTWYGARNALLAATCIYLAGEWAGSLWCLNWFGDSWQWSRGFFRSSIPFLAAMAACHISGPAARTRILKACIGCLPGIFILWMIFFH